MFGPRGVRFRRDDRLGRDNGIRGNNWLGRHCRRGRARWHDRFRRYDSDGLWRYDNDRPRRDNWFRRHHRCGRARRDDRLRRHDGNRRGRRR